MIYEIAATNSGGEVCTMTLASPEKSGLVVIDIQGLGPGKSTINMRENMLTNGSTFNSAKMPARNIVLTLKFLPLKLEDPPYNEIATIENTRISTYQYFPIGSRIRLDVTTDRGKFYIYGYVESNEPTIFSLSEGAVISILCPDPAFRVDSGMVVKEVKTSTSLFGFPFKNEGSLPVIKFGQQIFEAQTFPIDFAGSSNVSPTITLYAVGGRVVDPKIIFYDLTDTGFAENSISFVFSTDLPPLEDGDYLTIITEKSKKSVIRYVAAPAPGTDHFRNYIGAVAFDSAWPVLRPGLNTYSYTAVSGAAYIRFGYEYALQYSGV